MKLALAIATPAILWRTSSFTPLALFAASEQGGWYDPSDFSTLFQDAAGTTPVTGVEQPVGLVLDKSKGLAIGSELISPINFTTGWGSSGAAVTFDSASTFTAAGIANVFRVLVEVGKWYKITFNISFTSAGLNLYNDTTASNLINSGTIASGTSYTYYFLAAATQINFRPTSAGAVTVNSVTLTAIAGNHLTQSTTTARPVLSARVNLLTYTEEFDNAVWQKNNLTITPNTSIAPNGTTTADTLTGTGAGVTFLRGQTVFIAGQVKISFYVKADTATTCTIGDVKIGAIGSFDLSTGVVISGATASISSIGNGWYQCSVTYTTVAGATGFTINPGSTLAPTTTTSILIWGADLRPSNAGVGLPVYQRVTTSTDYDTTGFPLYLKFDGTDDFLVSGTINPGSVDKAQVFAGVRKLSDATVQVLYETSVNTNSYNGTISSFPGYAGVAASVGAYWDVGSKGTTLVFASSAASYPAPATAVQTHLTDISAPSLAGRINGSQVMSSVSSLGTGNFGSYPLYVGRRGGTTFSFNGHLYSLILRFSATNLDAATIASTETWVNSKTKAY